MRRTGLLLLTLALAAAPSGSAAAGPSGTWRGTFTLPRPVAFSVRLTARDATVTLPVGHAGPARVAVRVGATRVRFALPGRPTPLAFDGRLGGAAIRGTVTQAGLRGSFVLHRGSALDTGAAGVFRLPSGDAVSVTQPGGTPFLVDYGSGEIRGLFRRTATTWDIGAGLGVRLPAAGTATVTAAGLQLVRAGGTAQASRLPRREREIRFRSGTTTLAGTLSLPATAGRHPGVVLVHGSGTTPRTDGAVWAAFFASRGFAVLTYDKRGIAQSGGAYPGESASPSTTDTYARDAAAAARFLGRQPEVDPARVGLSGASQAGWIMPLAASRETSIHFLVLVSGPVVTTGEQATYQDLTTEGATKPALSPAEILAQVSRTGPYGFDPVPAIGALRIPALWLLGATDQNVPTALSVARLAPLAADPARDLSYVVFPDADHFLLENASGLAAEDLTTHLYAPGLFGTVDDWLLKRGLAPTGPQPA